MKLSAGKVLTFYNLAGIFVKGLEFHCFTKIQEAPSATSVNEYSHRRFTRTSFFTVI